MYTLNEQRIKHAIWLVLRLNVHKQCSGLHVKCSQWTEVFELAISSWWYFWGRLSNL